jgi:homoserine kinase
MKPVSDGQPAWSVRVRVPATTANLGPGFDCMGLALDLWNEAVFSLEGEGLRLYSDGEGRQIPADERNMIIQAMRFLCDERGLTLPPGLVIRCHNHIPVGSGLGSSAAAVLLGLLGAARLLDSPMDEKEALGLAARMEGHADNAAAALYGGLVIVASGKGSWLVQRIEIPAVQAAVVLPAFDLPTHLARAVLPGEVTMSDATFNIGRALFVVEALRSGNLDLLNRAMDDRLHMPYRLPLIPGAQAALEAAYQAGASAVTISGAGPSLIAFSAGDTQKIAGAMVSAFRQKGVTARAFHLHTIAAGALVETGAPTGTGLSG